MWKVTSKSNMDWTFVKKLLISAPQLLISSITNLLNFHKPFKTATPPILANIFSLETDTVQQKLYLPGKYI